MMLEGLLSYIACVCVVILFLCRCVSIKGSVSCHFL